MYRAWLVRCAALWRLPTCTPEFASGPGHRVAATAMAGGSPARCS
ncbi:hypothetical protein AAGT00_29795 [Streptomyces cavourensis]